MYALFGVVLIPVCFLAIRLAESLIHPVVFTRDGPQMAGSQFATFCRLPRRRCCARSRTRSTGSSSPASASTQRLRELREAARVTAEEKYVAAAYLVVFVVLLVYVLIIATKLARLERDVEELTSWRASAGGARG